MPNNQNTGIWGIIITSVLALLGMSVSTILTGHWDTQLKKKEFQSQLIMQALESPDIQQRQTFLQFLLDTNLIENKEIRQGLSKYSSHGGEKAIPPQHLKTN